MKAMKQAKEYFQAPPPGRYLSRITAVEEKISKAGSSMLKIDGEVIEPKEYAGSMFTDYIITDGMARGAGMGKKKLRGLGINVDTDEEIPDSVIAQQIFGLELWIEYGNEQMMGKDESGEYTKPATAFDSQLGKDVPLNKLVVKEYARHNVGQKAAAPIAQVQAPQYAAPTAPTMQAPQGYPPGFAPIQQAPQYAQAPQGWPQQAPVQQAPAGAVQMAPQGFVPGQQMAPPGFPQGQFPGYPVNGGVAGAAPPWVTAQTTQPTEETAGKKGRGKKSAE